MYKISVSTNKKNRLELDKVVSELLSLGIGIKLADIVEESTCSEESIVLFFQNYQTVKLLKKIISVLNLKDCRPQVSFLEDRYWKNCWKEGLMPFKITKDFTVVPYDRSDLSLKNFKKIYLSTELAFGIGTHPTTKIMAEFIKLKKKECLSLLDVGCGTGILSILAEKYGFLKVRAVDIDKASVLTARKNVKTNNCKNISVNQADFLNLSGSWGQFDFVAANLLTEDLISLQDKLLSFVKTGKYLAVSGISLKNSSSFKKRFAKKDLICCKSMKNGDWAGFLYRIQR
ncbi:MAG: 50S ribosomal protein L11 methyltransferase [Candidatus Omnitrophica bacterium]|nr:50S ribosomal protein L11 methyltransferase [Candidatus Omnitrophota bacterium]